jgi:hypothetical protein
MHRYERISIHCESRIVKRTRASQLHALLPSTYVCNELYL